MPDRVARLRALLDDHAADALVLPAQPDLRWATGFTGSSGLLVVLRDAALFMTDGRYRAQAEAEVAGATVHASGNDLWMPVAEKGLLDGARVLVPADGVTLAQHEAWQRRLPGAVWKPVEGLMRALRGVKDAGEVERLRAAQALTCSVFEEVLALIRPGVSEQELAAEIVYRHLRAGAERMSFDPIVAGGQRAALPHARASQRPLAKGDLVVLDFGAYLDGYASDMTRTVAVGEPGEEARRCYDLVLAAQEAALAAARAGLEARALDAAARTVIAEGGYGEAFSHSLGHGIGLDVHEWPRVSSQSDEVLPEGAVVTIEPGVYLPGAFGIRIEDVVVLRSQGAENLTTAPKALLVL